MQFLRRFLYIGLIALTANANAALITLNEAGLDAVFSQASFGSDIVDIRIGTATEIVAPDLLDITSNTEISSLFGMHQGSSTDVNFYFVDTISACGGSLSSSIVGCGETPGNDFVVESIFAAGSYGAELLAHELGHNLGLGHMSGANLMNSALNNSTALIASQVATILASSLVQNDQSGYFININPVLVVASSTSVAEPETIAIFALALAFVSVFRRKNVKK